MAHAKETVYWEACLEKGERLEQKVSISADKKQIKSQYKKLSLIYHPDKPTGNDKRFMKSLSLPVGLSGW